MVEICVTNFFQFLELGGLTPGPKFTKRGDDLADSEIYHPAKFHRSTPTHAQDIPYKNPADKHTHTKTNKQTVNDISTACLSACVDNNNVNIMGFPENCHAILAENVNLGIYTKYSPLLLLLSLYSML